VVARAGAETLTLERVNGQIPEPFMGTVTVQAKRRLVEGWVEEELLYQEALERKLNEDPAVTKRIVEATRRLLVAELLEREFRQDIDVLEGDYHNYYEAHQEDFVRDQAEIRVRHILVENKTAQTRVWERLRGGESFDGIAREVSIDASAESGGDLGYFIEVQVDPSFWTACQKARLGRRTRIQTKLGYHVIEVLDRREAGTMQDLLEVRGEVRQRILALRREKRRETVLEAVKQKMTWSIDLEKLDLVGPSAASPP
jgi:parvulin-like peptidyl-prolyl isomerase